MVLATIARAAATSTTARRDFVMVKGSYLLGCRVSELCRLQWKDIEPLEGAGQVHLLGKGSEPRTVRISTTTLELFESLGRGAPEDWLFPSNKKNGPLTRQGVAARMARWGKAADVHLYPHRCRHTHATHGFGGGGMFSPFQRRSVTARREQYLTTFLLSLERVHLSNWVDGPF